MKLVAFFFLLGIAPSMGLACSCVFGSGCWSVSIEGFEFVGKAREVHAVGEGAVSVDFAVSEAFGKLSGKTTLTVYTKAQSTACGYPVWPNYPNALRTHGFAAPSVLARLGQRV